MISSTILLHMKSAFIKAMTASLLFSVFYIFYDSEIVRNKIEDVAFDIINKFTIESTKQDTNSSKVMVFAVDDLYMKTNSLYDDYNRSNYGYLFPRGKIADFIEQLDELSEGVEIKNRPKALFIDYDMSFTMMPYGQKLSKEDNKLIEVLKRPRPYMIFLAKTDYYNFIENSKDPIIQEKIKNKKIIFVSVSLLESNDGIVRRYEAYKKFQKKSSIKEYENIDLALWQLMNNKKVNLNELKKKFSENDVVGNRVLIKAYQGYNEEDDCSFSKSYWNQLSKYSANCSLFDIVEEDFANSVIMLGGTHANSSDRFEVLNVLKPDSFTGIDMHANTLMSILYLNGNMKRLPLTWSILIIFGSFFLISILISTVFSQLKRYNNKIEFIVLLSINTILLIVVSSYLLNVHKLWFNWFIPLVLFQLIEIFNYLKTYIPKVISKMRKEA